MRLVTMRPWGVVNVTCSSRGIDIIEIVGLLGSMRTSSISLECGRTLPKGLLFGGGRSSLPTSSSVSAAPRLVGASTFGASFTRLLSCSASTTPPTSFSASTVVAAADTSTTPSPPSSTRLAIHQRRRGGSGTIEDGGLAPDAGEIVGGLAALTSAQGTGGRLLTSPAMRECDECLELDVARTTVSS